MIENWPAQLARALKSSPCVMVTLLTLKGSAPRAVGSRMIIGTQQQWGSIGGGNLEFEAAAMARDMLQGMTTSDADTDTASQVPFGLGPALNQCCGGAVTLLFEPIRQARPDWLSRLLAVDACDPHQPTGAAVESPCASSPVLLITSLNRTSGQKWSWQAGDPPPLDAPDAFKALQQEMHAVAAGQPLLLHHSGTEYVAEWHEARKIPLLIFGAGHVGQAVVKALQDLPFHIRWVDSRKGQFPESPPPGVKCVLTDEPMLEAQLGAAGRLYLVMTHSHQLDEDLCHTILARNDARWLGLIGSVTKRRRFVHRLAARGLNETQLAQLQCPVGATGIEGKRPATIALAIAVQLLSQQVPEHWR